MDYQGVGAGKSSAAAWCDLALVPDPAAALAKMLGKLAWCRLAPGPSSPTAGPEADARARMAARGAIFASPSDAHRAYPDLFSSPKAAQHAMARAALRPAGAIWNGQAWRQVSYRPAGRGQQTRSAIVAADRLAGFRTELETLLGPLAHYAVAGPPPDPSPPPAAGLTRAKPVPPGQAAQPEPGTAPPWMRSNGEGQAHSPAPADQPLAAGVAP